MDFRKTLDGLRSRLSALNSRRLELSGERRPHALASMLGSPDAKSEIDKIDREAALVEHESATCIDAIAAAEALARAEDQRAKQADLDCRRAEAVRIANVLRKRYEDIDEHLVALAKMCTELDADVSAFVRTGLVPQTSINAMRRPWHFAAAFRYFGLTQWITVPIIERRRCGTLSEQHSWLADFASVHPSEIEEAA